MKTVVIFSHSYPEISNANKAIVEVYKQAGFEVRNLEELYPDGNINVENEQAALLAADVIVFQHPTFWFNVPALLKKWEDEVLKYGWAFGTGGDKLKGKKFLHSFTTGSPAENYANGLSQAITLGISAMAGYCGMEVLEPMGAYGLNAMVNPNVKEEATQHANKVVELIKSL